MVNIEGGRYVGPIILESLADLVEDGRTGRRGGGSSDGRGGGSDGDNGCGGGGATAKKRKSSSTGGGARLQVRYDSHLSTLALWYGEKSRSILTETVLPTLHGAVL